MDGQIRRYVILSPLVGRRSRALVYETVYLSTTDSAKALSIAPSTLRRWTLQYAYPRSRARPGDHRQFLRADVLALAAALSRGHSIGAAVEIARLLPAAREDDQDDMHACGK